MLTERRHKRHKNLMFFKSFFIINYHVKHTKKHDSSIIFTIKHLILKKKSVFSVLYNGRESAVNRALNGRTCPG
jgi:hypothetical protein